MRRRRLPRITVEIRPLSWELLPYGYGTGHGYWYCGFLCIRIEASMSMAA